MQKLSELRMLCFLTGTLYSLVPCCAMDGEQPKRDRNPATLKLVGIPKNVLEAAGYTILALKDGSVAVLGPNPRQNVSDTQTKNANG